MISECVDVKPDYNLERIERHAINLRDNAWDINSGLRGVLIHLRGEVPVGEGVEGKTLPDGKLVEISLAQQAARSAQDETFRLIAELQGLLNVNA